MLRPRCSLLIVFNPGRNRFFVTTSMGWDSPGETVSQTCWTKRAGVWTGCSSFIRRPASSITRSQMIVITKAGVCRKTRSLIMVGAPAVIAWCISLMESRRACATSKANRPGWQILPDVMRRQWPSAIRSGTAIRVFMSTPPGCCRRAGKAMTWVEQRKGCNRAISTGRLIVTKRLRGRTIWNGEPRNYFAQRARKNICTMYARSAADESWMGRQQTKHYQYYPFMTVGHFRLYDLVDANTRRELAA